MVRRRSRRRRSPCRSTPRTRASTCATSSATRARKVVVVQRTLADRVATVLGDLPELEHVIVVRRPRRTGRGAARSTRRPRSRCTSGTTCCAVDDATPDVTIRPSDLATFIYTGGTTGPSKGCMLSHNYHEALARQIGICWERTADDVVWTPLPLFHYNALVTAVLGSLVFGGRGAIYRRFSVSNFWPEMNRVGATITSTLGTMAYLLANDTDRPEMPQSGAPEANTTAAPARRRAAARRGRQPAARPLRRRDVQRRVRSHRGEPRVVAAAGRAQQAERGGRAEHRVLRRAPVRRRREGSARRARRARSSSARSDRT